MKKQVAIVGIGATQFRSLSPDVYYKELMFEAAVKAYDDAGINPRRDVDTFVTCAEDYVVGMVKLDGASTVFIRRLGNVAQGNSILE